jgi:DNA-binding transcriptional LysR family regulator
MSLTLRQLEIIHAVCRHGSVTLAAAALDISQPAVSMMLRDCTRLAGFALFQRKHGRLQPTAEMRGLLIDLERVFEGVERVGRLVDDMRDSSIGTVQVAATPTLADNLLPAALAAFQRARPRIQVTLEAMENRAVVEAVLRERVDFGLVLAPVNQPEARLINLSSAALVCVVSPDHKLAGRESVTPGDLAPYPLISFSRSLPLGHLVEESFRQAGVPRRIALEVNQSSVACALARAGVGVAVVDPFMLTDQRDHGVVALKLLPLVTVSAQAVVPRDATLSRPALMLLATIRRATSAARGGHRMDDFRPAAGISDRTARTRSSLSPISG